MPPVGRGCALAAQPVQGAGPGGGPPGCAGCVEEALRTVLVFIHVSL